MALIDRALRVGEGKKFKAFEKNVARINDYEPEFELYSDEELREAADALRERGRNGEPLDDLLFESFALTREAGRRTMEMRHFDVQLIGGMVLHDGSIAEMKTGEGKTLTATLAVVLNTLAGDAVHLVTVNDYLARRDAEWMKPIYDALGVTRRHPPVRRPRPGREARAVRRRRHLRHQLRVRLRLPARQPRDPARGQGPARPPVRDRRRGRQHPHRRGAHAADHLRRSPSRPPTSITSSRSSPRCSSRARSPRGSRRSRRSTSRTSTTSPTRSTRRSRSPSAASRRPRSSSASRTCTSPSTATSSTT